MPEIPPLPGGLPENMGKFEAAMILVVEDDDGVRETTAEILRGAGYNVLEASGSLEALEIFTAKGRIDLLLTDVVMYGMTGPVLAAKIMGLQSDVKVLFMSGFAGQACQMVPSEQLIDKPFMLSELLERIASMLASRKAMSA